jgi:hypothetical protein
VDFHIHTAAAEANALCFQTESLLGGMISPQLDFPARSEHPLPGQSEGSIQYARDLTRVAGQPDCSSDCAIGGNLTSRNGANSGANAGFGRYLLSRAVLSRDVGKQDFRNKTSRARPV